MAHFVNANRGATPSELRSAEVLAGRLGPTLTVELRAPSGGRGAGGGATSDIAVYRDYHDHANRQLVGTYDVYTPTASDAKNIAYAVGRKLGSQANGVVVDLSRVPAAKRDAIIKKLASDFGKKVITHAESEMANYEYESELEGEYEFEGEGEYEFEGEGEYEFEGEGEYEFEGEGEYEPERGYEPVARGLLLDDALGSVVGGEGPRARRPRRRHHRHRRPTMFALPERGPRPRSGYYYDNGGYSRPADAGPLSEAQEAELAGELLEVQSEEELEEFLGDIFKSVGNFFRNSPVGKVLGGVIKTGLGALPGVGGVIGRAAGSLIPELELEGMDQHEAEFEAARRVVRVAASAAENAAMAPPGAPARQVARHAFRRAAQQHAPELLRAMNGDARSRLLVGSVAQPGNGDSYALGAGGPRRSGRWIRRGRKIVLLGV